MFYPARLLGGCNPSGTPVLGTLAVLSSEHQGDRSIPYWNEF
jgi:hypothetical protein